MTGPSLPRCPLFPQRAPSLEESRSAATRLVAPRTLKSNINIFPGLAQATPPAASCIELNDESAPNAGCSPGNEIAALIVPAAAVANAAARRPWRTAATDQANWLRKPSTSTLSSKGRAPPKSSLRPSNPRPHPLHLTHLRPGRRCSPEDDRWIPLSLSSHLATWLAHN